MSTARATSPRRRRRRASRRWSMSRRSAPIPNRPRAYGRTKGEGEAAVRAAFPDATILRPSIVFGPEDEFVNRFAGDDRRASPVVPVLARRGAVPAGLCRRRRRGGRRARWPIRARCRQDLRAGRARSASTMGELIRWIADAIGRDADVRRAARRRRRAIAMRRLPARRADHLGSVADAPDDNVVAGACRASRARHRADAARRGRAGLAGALPQARPLRPSRRRLIVPARDRA